MKYLKRKKADVYCDLYDKQTFRLELTERIFKNRCVYIFYNPKAHSKYYVKLRGYYAKPFDPKLRRNYGRFLTLYKAWKLVQLGRRRNEMAKIVNWWTEKPTPISYRPGVFV